MYANYHSHSQYCDGKGMLEAQVESAIAHGLKSFGVSSHGPVPFENQWSMKAERLPAYLAEIKILKNKYAGQIELYAGLEVDFLPDIEHAYVSLLDYHIGSVHYVGQNQTGQPWEIDGSSTAFLSCLDSLYNANIQTVVLQYFGLIRQMVETSPPDIVGHLDKIKIHNAARLLFDESEKWYVEAIENTLQSIVRAGIMVEINTRGHYKKGLDLYPSPWVIGRMNTLKIPICINSDSHRPDEMTASFDYAHAVASQAGYTTKQVMLGGQWTEAAL
jgi:histidinol-phosphatase (PHP family)